MAGDTAGGLSLGFQMTPLTSDGNLDTSGDYRGGRHPIERDTLYKLACENREKGNERVKEGKYGEAVGRYSELIMQLRSLENEEDVVWTDESRVTVRKLRAAAYLNLSLCFIKEKQWQHASNTATRALQGDKDPPDPKEDVLEPEKKAKALFRRATAQCEGFGNFDKARDDLKKALEYSPEDKAVLQMYKKCQVAVSKVTKQADKKMSGFLKKATAESEDGGLFDDSLRPTPEQKKGPELPSEPVKVSEGLWMMPKKEKKPMTGENGEIDFDEVTRELNELRESDPEAFAELRGQVQQHLETQAARADVDKSGPSEGEALEAPQEAEAATEAAGAAVEPAP